MPSHQPSSGLPPRVSRHGRGFRIRFRPAGPGTPYRNSPVFATPEECVAFERQSRTQSQTPGPAPSPRFIDYLENVWWHSYVRNEQLQTTRDHRTRIIRTYLHTARWATDPAMTGRVDHKLLTTWFDMLIDDAVPAHAVHPGLGEYEYQLDLDAVHGMKGSAARPSRAEIGAVLWMVRDCYAGLCRDPDFACDHNPAEGITLKADTRARRDALRAQRIHRKNTRKVQRHHVQALGRSLDAVDLLPFWFMCLGGLRISEAYGVRVRDWIPEERLLMVTTQRRERESRAGKPVVLSSLKSEAGHRYIWVCEAFGDAIDAYIRAVHGPDPDPGAPICVAANGPGTRTNAISGARSRLRAAALELGLTVDRPGYRGVPLDLRPHGLRKFISSYLHSQGVSEAARSEYLGHRISRPTEDPNGSETTISVYTDADLDELKKIAEIIGALVRELDLDLQPRNGADYVTAVQAAEILGVTSSAVYQRMREGTLTVHSNVQRPYGTTHIRKFLRRADIEALRDNIRPSNADAVTADVAAHMLRLTVADVLRLSNPRSGAELQRWTGSAGGWNPPDTFITRACIEQRLSIERRIRSGELVTAKETARRLGKSLAAGLDKPGRDYWLYNGRRYYDTDRIAELRAETWPEGHIALGLAARELHVPIAEFLKLAGPQLRSLDVADAYRPIPHSVLDDVRAALTDDKRRRRQAAHEIAEANPVRPVLEAPDPAAWVRLTQTASHFGTTASTVAALMAEHGMPRVEWDRELYGRRVDVDRLAEQYFPTGWLTIAQGAAHANRSQDWIRYNTMPAHGRSRAPEFRTKTITVRGRRRRLVNRQDLDLWMVRNDPTRTQGVPFGQASDILGVSHGLLRRLLDGGRIPYDGDRSTPLGRRRMRIRRADLEAFRLAETPPDGWLTPTQVIDQLAERGCRMTKRHLYTLLKHGEVPGRQFALAGSHWYLPSHAADVVLGGRPNGSVGITTLLTLAGYTPHPRLYALVRRWAPQGLIPGAVQATSAGRWRYPPEAAAPLRELLTTAGHQPDREPVRTGA